MPQGTRDRLRERFLDTKGHWVPEGPKGKPPTGELPRRPYVRSDERAIGYVPYEKGELPDPLPATLVAFYLPQFHTIPENDEWWGKGFTEWRNVTRALPQFEGHYQPKLPGDLGFYDLRNVEVMHEQARLAREYGISAFCFYFYWFGGKTLLETPLRNWLNDKTIDLKFCLCWANEKWTRTWDGRGDEILIDQKHSPEDDIAFIEHVAEYMRDPRYLRVDGKPVLLVYRPGTLPDASATARRWREWWSEQEGGDIHIGYVQSFDALSPATFGFDSAIAFPPNQGERSSLTQDMTLINPSHAGFVLDWRAMAASFMQRPKVNFLRYAGVNCGWDNEPRRPGKAQVFAHASPRGYGDWLKYELRSQAGVPAPLVFINAWNEWAEGAVLEPDTLNGHAYLDATRRALIAASTRAPSTNNTRPHVILHAWYVDVLRDVLRKLSDVDKEWALTITTDPSLLAEVTRTAHVHFPDAQIIATENRGRDILPFLIVANQLLDRGVDVVLKLHTKRSPHLSQGAAWREDMLGNLLQQDAVNAIETAFRDDPSLGLVAPVGHLLPVTPYLGANSEKLSSILTIAGLGGYEPSTQFAAGSMFWVRLDALRPLLDHPFAASNFDEEAGQVDGTFAHAMERAIGRCVAAAGYRLIETSLFTNSLPRSKTGYAYARKY